jgi:CBS domain-containing protein
MMVKEIMSSYVQTIDGVATVQQAAAKMKKPDVSFLPVDLG